MRAQCEELTRASASKQELIGEDHFAQWMIAHGASAEAGQAKTLDRSRQPITMSRGAISRGLDGDRYHNLPSRDRGHLLSLTPVSQELSCRKVQPLRAADPQAIGGGIDAGEHLRIEAQADRGCACAVVVRRGSRRMNENRWRTVLS